MACAMLQNKSRYKIRKHLLLAFCSELIALVITKH